MLIDPIFQIESRPITGYRATVTGFAGYYKVGLNGLDEVVEKNYKQEDIDKYLILKDPSILEVLNRVGNTEVINIYEGKEPKQCNPKPEAPAPKEAPAAPQGKKR